MRRATMCSTERSDRRSMLLTENIALTNYVGIDPVSGSEGFDEVQIR